MDEKEKVPPTSEPNPNEGEEVNTSDLDDKENQGGQPKPTGEDGQDGGTKPEEEGKDPAKPKQSRKTDAEYAEERRRRKEREESARKKREEEIRRQAVFDVKKEQVTAEELGELGLTSVADEDELFLVESLRKAKAEGVESPQVKAYQALREKQTKAKAEAEAKTKAEAAELERRKATVAKDQADFKAKFGKTTAEVIKNEPEFMDLFGDLIDPDKGNFTPLYSAYMSMKSGQAEKAKAEGSFPITPSVNSGKEGEESDEEFMKRWKAMHGHW